MAGETWVLDFSGIAHYGRGSARYPKVWRVCCIMAWGQPVIRRSGDYVVYGMGAARYPKVWRLCCIMAWGQPVTRRFDKEWVPRQLDRELPIYFDGGKKNLWGGVTRYPKGQTQVGPSGWQLKR